MFKQFADLAQACGRRFTAFNAIFKMAILTDFFQNWLQTFQRVENREHRPSMLFLHIS
jgi:hypothetical protein